MTNGALPHTRLCARSLQNFFIHKGNFSQFFISVRVYSRSMQVGGVILLRFFSNILLLCSRISFLRGLCCKRYVRYRWSIGKYLWWLVVNDNEITTVHQRCEIPKVQALCDFYDSYGWGIPLNQGLWYKNEKNGGYGRTGTKLPMYGWVFFCWGVGAIIHYGAFLGIFRGDLKFFDPEIALRYAQDRKK